MDKSDTLDKTIKDKQLTNKEMMKKFKSEQILKTGVMIIGALTSEVII